jgi:hypothetical protein
LDRVAAQLDSPVDDTIHGGGLGHCLNQNDFGDGGRVVHPFLNGDDDLLSVGGFNHCLAFPALPIEDDNGVTGS